MIKFFKTMFSNDQGTSHKRVLGTLGFVCLLVFLFTCKENVKAEAIAAVEFITISAIFGTVVEKFASKKSEE